MWDLGLCANLSWIKPMNLCGINFLEGMPQPYFVCSLYGNFGLGTWEHQILHLCANFFISSYVVNHSASIM